MKGDATLMCEVLKTILGDYVPPPVDIERRNRILVALWAHAYEVHNNPLVDDFEFDMMCMRIDTSVDTGHPVMDKWFKEKFDPYTGMWVLSHPEKNRLETLYQNLKGCYAKKNGGMR